MGSRKIVQIGVSPSFFDMVFEPSRKKMQKKLGVRNVSQKAFTEMLYKSGVSLDINFNPLSKKKIIGGKKNVKRFSPKK